MSEWQVLGLVLALVLVSWVLGAYNRLQRMRGTIGQAAQQVDEPLRRRDELIAGLLSLLRPLGERTDLQALNAVDEAGTALVAAANALLQRPCQAELPMRLGVTEMALQSVLQGLLQEVERDPTLRLLPGMLERLAGISEAERRLRFGRQVYNDAVKAYNAALDEFPTRLLRRAFGLEPAATI